jgi:L-ascorbate metabolism protein UlaG (beta-lactamase superfamily)
VEITWLGHACFRLRGRDVAIVTDPYGGSDWDYPPFTTSAEIVTISHDHPHHANMEAISGRPRVLRDPGEYEIRGAMIWGVRTFRRAINGDDAGRPKNTAYVITVEDLTICHLGDLGHALTGDQLSQIKDSSVLLIPVGGHCTIGAAEAAEVVAQIEPRIIIPMHYETQQTTGYVELDGVDRFCREMGATEAAVQNRLNVTASNLPSEATVILLEQRR